MNGNDLLVKDAWSPYRPSKEFPWDGARVVNLHRRASLGAPWYVVRRDVDDGFEKSVERVLAGDAIGPDGRTAAEFQSVSAVLNDAARNSPDFDQPGAAWVFRLAHTPHGLAERMSLGWHTHFACGLKYDRGMVVAFNFGLRERWRAKLSELLTFVVTAPAMQSWLDGPVNLSEHPNENLAREFLELFALGRGNGYTERDIREAARALTGFQYYSDNDTTVRFSPAHHDGGSKTILGKTGRWKAEDVARIAAAHPAAARHVARRLFKTFISDIETPAEKLIEALAGKMRTADDVDIAKGIETVVRSRLFHESAGRSTRIKSPVDFVVGTIRSLGLFESMSDMPTLDSWLGKLGFRFYRPPSVAGWQGGSSWLTPDAVVARMNFASELTGVESALRKAGFRDRNSWPESLAGQLLGQTLGQQDKAALVQLVKDEPNDARLANRLTQRLLALPQGQV